MISLSSLKFIGTAIFALSVSVSALSAAEGSHRLALVIGNGEYKSGVLATAASDSALIATTLQNAGFEVTAARDLDGDTLRKSMADFTAKLSSAAPDAFVFVYLGGYGFQSKGENYFAPVDAAIASEADVATQSIKVSDFLHGLTAQPVKNRIVVLDGAHKTPFAQGSEPTSGLAYIEPDAGSLIAFNAAPGAVAPEATAANGLYATALADFIAKGGLQPDDMFGQMRLKVSEVTKSAEVPWHLAKLDGSFTFSDPVSAIAVSAEPAKPVEVARPVEVAKPLELPKPANTAASAEKPVKLAKPLPIPLKTLEAVRPPDEPAVQKPDAAVRKDLAQRKLAEQKKSRAKTDTLAWQRADSIDTPSAYRSYLNRFPNGLHAVEARQALNEYAPGSENTYVERGDGAQDAGPQGYFAPRAYYGPRYSRQVQDQYGEPLTLPPRAVYPPHRRYVEQDDLEYVPQPRFGRFLFNVFP